jgi:hypothetical protein
MSLISLTSDARYSTQRTPHQRQANTMPYCDPRSLSARPQDSSLPNSYIGENPLRLHNIKQIQAMVQRGTDSLSPNLGKELLIS